MPLTSLLMGLGCTMPIYQMVLVLAQVSLDIVPVPLYIPCVRHNFRSCLRASSSCRLCSWPSERTVFLCSAYHRDRALMPIQNVSCWMSKPVLKSSWSVSVLLLVRAAKVSLSITHLSPAVAPERCDKTVSSWPKAKQGQRPLNMLLVHSQGLVLETPLGTG